MVLYPWVTIGIPFSRERVEHLELAVRSVFAQTVSAWELILIADGATEDLLELVGKISDVRVRVIRDGKHVGLSCRLNQLAALASHNFLFRMDADDIMWPDRIHRQMEILSRGDCDVIGSRTVLIDELGRVQGLFREPEMPIRSTEYLRSNAFSHPSVAGSTEWFRRNKYDEAFIRSEDKELWLRTNESSVFVKMDEPLLFYRVNRSLGIGKRRLSSQWDRQAVRRHGERLVGRAGVQVLLAVSLAKELMFAVAIFLGGTKLLYRRKYEVLPVTQHSLMENILVAVRKAVVPGWDATTRQGE